MISALHIGFQLSVLSLDIKEKKKKNNYECIKMYSSEYRN